MFHFCFYFSRFENFHRKFSLKFLLKIFIENFQPALSFTWRTLKVPKILRNAHWPGTGLFPEPPMILLSFFLFFYFFFAFYSDSTDEGSNPERIGGYSTYHTLSIASVNHKILFELNSSLVCSYQPHWNPVYQEGRKVIRSMITLEHNLMQNSFSMHTWKFCYQISAIHSLLYMLRWGGHFVHTPHITISLSIFEKNHVSSKEKWHLSNSLLYTC